MNCRRTLTIILTCEEKKPHTHYRSKIDKLTASVRKNSQHTQRNKKAPFNGTRHDNGTVYDLSAKIRIFKRSKPQRLAHTKTSEKDKLATCFFHQSVDCISRPP